MSKHTPGPWYVDDFGCVTTDPEGIGTFIANCRYGEVVGYHRPAGNQREANARLIAAAPDMFDALDNILSMIDCGAWTLTNEEGQYPGLHQARQALFKAQSWRDEP